MDLCRISRFLESPGAPWDTCRPVAHLVKCQPFNPSPALTWVDVADLSNIRLLHNGGGHHVPCANEYLL